MKKEYFKENYKLLVEYLERYHKSTIFDVDIDPTTMMYVIVFENDNKTMLGMLAVEHFSFIKPSYDFFVEDYEMSIKNMLEDRRLEVINEQLKNGERPLNIPLTKLSELCKKHLVRLNYDCSPWKDSVVIQRGEPNLIYFKSKRYRSKIDVTTIVWVYDNGKIETIDGRFSISGGTFNTQIMNIILKNERIEMDFDVCKKLPNTKFT